jgi:hypothetical protein
MEVKLFHMRDRSPPGGPKYEVAAYGTEQGIQFRLIHTHIDPPTETDIYSLSYTEALQMSDDIEKGKPRERYGTAGSGFETRNWDWKDRANEP